KVTLKNQDAWSSPAHLHWKTSDFEPNEVLLITDNGSNVKKACNEIGIGERIPCAAHTLQLSIGKGLDKIRQLVDKFLQDNNELEKEVENLIYLDVIKASLISNVSLNIHKEGEKLEELYPTVHEWKEHEQRCSGKKYQVRLLAGLVEGVVFEGPDEEEP
ncbi:2229_t:CDS:2, partial [Rhizophagus irregularis]